MEFRFRAVDDRPPSYFSPSPTIGFFSGQALRAANYQIVDPRQNPELLRNEIVQREIEKERIREEIITEEIARRRALEAEVRRELMMEREMAMRIANGGGGGLSFEERMIMQLQPRSIFPFMNQFDNRRFGEHLPFPGCGVSDPWLRSLRLSESCVLPDVKPASEEKLIVLAKPGPNLCGGKRKAMTSPTGGAGELPNIVLKKKPKEEWSCALCQVSVSGESALNEHLQGRKHKAKEAMLRANKMAKNPSTVQMPKRNAVLKKVKIERESKKVDESENDTDKREKKGDAAKHQNDELPVWKNKQAEHLKKHQRERTQRKERTEEFRTKMKFSFWCEMCQKGAYAEAVMDAHKKGKKHLAKLQKLCQNSDAFQTITTVASSKADENTEDAEEIAEKLNEMGNVKTNDTVTEAVSDNQMTAENVGLGADEQTNCLGSNFTGKSLREMDNAAAL